MIVTLTGPTCSGKSTLESALMDLGCGKVISHTTRPIRDGEFDGIHYHFVTPKAFLVAADAGEFIESVKVDGNSYAVSAVALLAAQEKSEVVVIVVDPEGARQVGDFCTARGIDHSSIWVNCMTAVRTNRWIVRMLADARSGKDVTNTYALRLASMIDQESGWFESLRNTSIIHNYVGSRQSSEEPWRRKASTIACC